MREINTERSPSKKRSPAALAAGQRSESRGHRHCRRQALRMGARGKKAEESYRPRLTAPPSSERTNVGSEVSEGGDVYCA
jgi:hypothetical protein